MGATPAVMANIIDLDYEREKREMIADAKTAGIELANADDAVIKRWREAMLAMEDEIDAST